jgi:hypothetical protein
MKRRKKRKNLFQFMFRIQRKGKILKKNLKKEEVKKYIYFKI